MARSHVVPETFTHGSSADRVRWLRRGLDNGTIEACDTFSSSTN
jgi:predicted metalloprotease